MNKKDKLTELDAAISYLIFEWQNHLDKNSNIKYFNKAKKNLIKIAMVNITEKKKQ